MEFEMTHEREARCLKRRERERLKKRNRERKESIQKHGERKREKRMGTSCSLCINNAEHRPPRERIREKERKIGRVRDFLTPDKRGSFCIIPRP